METRQLIINLLNIRLSEIRFGSVYFYLFIYDLSFNLSNVHRLDNNKDIIICIYYDKITQVSE
jgi:hypothetical protein